MIGVALTVTTTLVIVTGPGFTVTCALPDFVASCAEVAVMVAEPVAAGVNSPVLDIAPALDGFTDQVTALL